MMNGKKTFLNILQKNFYLYKKETTMLKYLLFLFLIPFLPAQQLNEFGLYVIDNKEDYLKDVLSDSSNLIIDLEEFINGIELDIKYASEDNFSSTKVYDSSRAFLRYPAAAALKSIQNELAESGLALKIFDAYRPYSVTVFFYDNYPDSNYVASKWKGSRHNRACAVDLTLIYKDSGKELEMPTGYDDFSEKAHVDFMVLSEEVLQNRDILRKAMEKYGFKAYPYEWWHFDFIGWEKFPLTDLDFHQIDAANQKLTETNNGR